MLATVHAVIHTAVILDTKIKFDIYIFSLTGRSAGSEIETTGVVNFLTSKIGTWDMYMSFHSYGQWWL